MSKQISRGLMSLVLMLPVPLLLGAKGGCGDVSMGSDDVGDAGMAGEPVMGESGRASGGGGSTGSAGTSMMGGRAQGGSPAMGGSPMNGGAAGTAGQGAQCDGFENTTFRDAVTVRYVNDGDETVYVGRTRTDTCDGGFSFELEDATGEPLVNSSPDRSCTSCQALQNGSPVCTTDCPQGLLVRIDPGGSYDFSWAGVYWAPQDMPKACFASAGFDRCSKLVQASPAEYRFVGRVWPEVACDENQGCTPCTPDATGSCIVVGLGAATGTAREVEEVLDYPTQKHVELHFD